MPISMQNHENIARACYFHIFTPIKQPVMKKILLFAFITAGLLHSFSVNAQYCGGASGSNICTPITTLHTPGFAPPQDSLPCIVVGQPYSQIINVHTPATVTSGGSTYNLSDIQIDTISNLPCGMCWAMGASNFQIAGNATGCLKLSGTTFDAPGQYLLHVIVNATVIVGIFPITESNQNLASQGLKYFVRVTLPNDTCPLVDTLATGNTASHAGALAAPTISGNTVLCTGGSTTLTASGSNIYAYAWSNGTFSPSITVNQTGTYTVTVYGNCTSATASKTITHSVVRDTITAGGPTTFCQGGNVALSVPTGSSVYNWSNGGTTNNITATNSGTYTVTVTNTNGCSAVSSGVTINVNAAPVDTISANGPIAFCPGGTVTLSGPSGLTYHWSNGNTTQSITVSQGSYLLTVTNANNCSAISSLENITVYPTPNNGITAGGPTTFCAGNSVTLTAASNLTYLWSTGATTQSINATQSASYTVTVTNNNACTAVSSPTVVTVTPGPVDTVSASGPLSFCAGGSVALTADAGISGLAYNWSNGSTVRTISVTQAGSYTVTVTNGNNCTAVSIPVVVSIAANISDTVTASGPTTFCAGGSVLLTAAPGLTYHWSNAATSQSINVTQSGTYSVTLTSNTCSATSTPIQITVNGNPNNAVTASGPTTFCAGDSVTLTASSGVTYNWSTGATTAFITTTQAGNYSVTVTNANNCTAASSLIQTAINARPSPVINANGPTTFCPGGSVTLSANAGFTYLWSNGLTTQNITVSQPGSYTVTLTSAQQCSAASSATLVSLYSATSISTQPVSQVTCISGNVTFSVVAGGNNITYQWQKNGININGQTNSGYNIPAAALSDTGNYRVVVSGLCGTDTSNVASLGVTGSITFSQQPASQTICVGDRVSFSVVANGVNTAFQWLKNGQNISNANSATYVITSVATTDTGTFTCYVTSNCGNATSNPATLKVNLPTSSSINQNICLGSHFNFNGRSLSSAGIYLDTLTNAHGCDSIITLTLTVSPAITSSFSDSICSGSTYNFNGTNLSNAGTYTDTLITQSGCDSIVTLHLSIRQRTSSNVNAGICQGQSYRFNGVNLTSAGTYRDTLTGSNGCDSVIILHLSVNQQSTSTINSTICFHGSYNFNGRILNQGGTYTDTLTNVAGCDSIITLHLTVITSVYYSYSASICSNSSYNFNGRILTTGGIYSDTIPSVGGCDSVITLSLGIIPVTGSTITDSICHGASYSFAGQTLTASGTYYDTLTNARGCDSIVTLNLVVSPPIRTGIHAIICQGSSYSFNGLHLTVSGTYYATLTTAQGCDSAVTLVLQVSSYLTGSINAAICAGSSYNFNGRHIAVAGNYNDTLVAQGGCDSIVTLHLTVNQPATSNIHAAICAGGAYFFNGQNLTAAGTYSETLAGSNGCDSIVNLTLQINPFVTSAISATVCNGTPYNFNGQNLTTAGTYRDTLTALGGCDSIVTLTLSVSQATSSTITAAICVGSTYFFNGVPVGNTGTYFESLTGSNGCDSIVTLQLTVNSFLTSTTNASICAGNAYNFNGRNIVAAGTYYDTLLARGGCDSIAILNLTVNPVPVTQNSQAIICQGTTFNFNGHLLSTTGVYSDTLTTQSGCDSITILHLTVTPISTGTVNASICSGTSYTFNGRTLTSGGVYADTLTAQSGCDSVVTLHLNLIPAPHITLNEAICTGSSYNFNGHNYVAGGTYADTLVAQSGCDSITTLILTIEPLPVITWNQRDTICDNNGATQVTITAPTPAGGTLTGNGLNGLVLTVSGSAGPYPVTYTYIDSAGCSNTVTKNLMVETCLGIDEITLENAISLYPNPATNVVIAQADIFDGLHNAPVILDIAGKSMPVPFTRNADKITFNTSSLASGFYLIKFNINGTAVSKRFVKAD